MTARYYQAIIGTAELGFWQKRRDDARAERLVCKWIRAFWSGYVERSAVEGLGRGSIRYAIDSAPDVEAVLFLRSEGSSESVIGSESQEILRFRVANMRSK